MRINLIKTSPSTILKNKLSLVFIHGAWHGAWCWEEHYFPYFTNLGFTCYAFDLPNHGQSKFDKGINKYRISDYVSYLKLALQQIKSPFILIGHSMGGFVIQKYLERDDECLGAILLTSVPPKPIWRIFFNYFKKMPFSMAKLILTRNLTHVVNTPEKAGKMLFSPTLSQEKIEAYANQLGTESFNLLLFDFLFGKLKPRKNQDIPLLVLGTDNDRMISIKENNYTADFHKADFQIINGPSHDLMLDPNWEVAAKVIFLWLKDKFPKETNALKQGDKNSALKTSFSNALPDLITKLANNYDSHVDDSNLRDKESTK